MTLCKVQSRKAVVAVSMALMFGAGLLAFPACAKAASGPAASVAPAAVAVSPVVLPHRAIYRMSLDSVRNGSQIQAIEGLLYFDWQDACDGWNVEHRLTLNMTRDEGVEVEVKSNYTTWESKDGTRFRFNYRYLLNGNVAEEYRGSAVLKAPGQTGLATYTIPAAREVKLPLGSYFPSSHTLALLQAATGQKPLFAASVFDGTDEHGLSEISAIIGRQQPVAVEAARTGLGDMPAVSWPIRMAFFPFEQDEAEPDYEMDTNLLPNGVSEFMLMDYGEFRLRGTLEQIELLEDPGC